MRCNTHHGYLQDSLSVQTHMAGTGRPEWPFAILLRSRTTQDLLPDLQSFLAASDQGRPSLCGKSPFFTFSYPAAVVTSAPQDSTQGIPRHVLHMLAQDKNMIVKAAIRKDLSDSI